MRTENRSVNNPIQKKPVRIFFFLFSPAILFFLVATGPAFSVSDKAGVPVLKWTGPGEPGSFEAYRFERPVRPFQVNHIEFLSARASRRDNRMTGSGKVMVLAGVDVFSEMAEKILRYANDINRAGYAVQLVEWVGGNAGDLRGFIGSNMGNLLGCVFIGDLPAAWYEVEDDYYSYGYAQFPCDLYFMDLDGRWQDSNGNGIFDYHRDGSGDRQPEIFVARIDASRMEGNRFENLSLYFDKNHEYWQGNLHLLQYGMTYTEDDWSMYEDITKDVTQLYPGNYKAIRAPETSRDDYLENRLTNPLYELIQLACHSNSSAHYFTRGGALASREIIDVPPRGMVYNLFCCSALRFTDMNCLGGAYIFNRGAKALTVVGSTKTGSMLEFHHFYRALAGRNVIGLALKIWFEQIAPYDDYDLFWHYGMTIMGDPMVVLKGAEKSVFPPVDLSVTLAENLSLLLSEYIHRIKWIPNPLNVDADIYGYRITRLLDGEPGLVATVFDGSNEYLQRGVSAGTRYVYGVSSIRHDGLESYPAYVEISDETE